MLIIYLLMIAAGGYFWFMGLKTKRLGRVKLANEEFLAKVAKEDRAQYISTLGKSWQFIGLGLIGAAAVNAGFDTKYGWIICALGVTTGIVLMFYCDYRIKGKQKEAIAAKEHKKQELKEKKEQAQHVPTKNKKRKKK